MLQYSIRLLLHYLKFKTLAVIAEIITHSATSKKHGRKAFVMDLIICDVFFLTWSSIKLIFFTLDNFCSVLRPKNCLDS